MCAESCVPTFLCATYLTNSMESIYFQTPPPVAPERHLQRPAMSAHDMLFDMGFFDRGRNEKLLKQFGGDINKCVTELLRDNDWHATRH